MGKALAFLSYGINAGLMLGISLFLAKTLSAVEYSRYSLAVAVAQTCVVFVSEWVRHAAARFFPGPNPAESPQLRSAFVGGQYLLGLCGLFLAFLVAVMTADSSWLLIMLFAVSLGIVDLQFVMLRFDSQFTLFSRLQVFRGLLSAILVTSATLLFRNHSAALSGAIFSNVLIVATLSAIRPEFVFVSPTIACLSTLQRAASYGMSVAAAGGLYISGPLFLRYAAKVFATDASQLAAYSLLMDLLQRPFNILLDASHGAFFPDVVREHDQSPGKNNVALGRLYAIHGWSLMSVFGCALAFRNDLMPFLVKAELLPNVFAIFPALSAMHLVHTANNFTCAVALILLSSGVRLIIQAAMEFVSILVIFGLWVLMFGAEFQSVIYGGLAGAIVGLLFASQGWKTVKCRLPWFSWSVAVATTIPLILIGQTSFDNHLFGLCMKIMLVGPILVFGAFFGFAIPFGILNRLEFRSWPIAWLSRFK